MAKKIKKTEDSALFENNTSEASEKPVTDKPKHGRKPKAPATELSDATPATEETPKKRKPSRPSKKPLPEKKPKETETTDPVVTEDKPKRGRPRKKAAEPTDTTETKAISAIAETEEKPKKRRGRPRKKPLPENKEEISTGPVETKSVLAEESENDNHDSNKNDADNEENPRRRRRKRRRGKSDPSQQDDQQNNAETEEETEAEEVIVSGILSYTQKSQARLRQLDDTFIADPLDPIVDESFIDKYSMRPGLQIEIALGKPYGNRNNQNNHRDRRNNNRRKKGRDRTPTINAEARRTKRVINIEGRDPETWAQGRNFDDLTIIMPEPRLQLEHKGCAPACRLIDLFCPIGKGTRGLIVSPPKAGKTTLMQQIAFALHENHAKNDPNFEVFALLVDERPEEVTEFRRNVPVKVWASSNDHSPERHVGLAIAAIERAKRMAEMGKDVVVLLDSLTRLGRAFNVASNVASTGRTMSGGLDAGALAIPKQLFGAARNFEEGGSLTIIATALVETGSRGDEVIFEEFKGTGNMEIVLDRRIAEQRMYPAINLAASGTRNDQKLMPEQELNTMVQLRRRLLNMSPPSQVEQLLKAIERYPSNAEMVGQTGN